MGNLLHKDILNIADSLPERVNFLVCLYASLSDEQRTRFMQRFVKKRKQMRGGVQSLLTTRLKLAQHKKRGNAEAKKLQRELMGWIKYVAVELKWSLGARRKAICMSRL